MAAPTIQTPITYTTTAVTFVPARDERRALTIQSYAGSVGYMYVAFGKTATAGTAGEWEIAPGAVFNWNGLMPPLQGNVPLQSISIIVTGGSATGAICEFL